MTKYYIIFKISLSDLYYNYLLFLKIINDSKCFTIMQMINKLNQWLTSSDEFLLMFNKHKLRLQVCFIMIIVTNEICVLEL